MSGKPDEKSEMMIEDKQEIQRKKSSLSKSRILFVILVVITFVVLIIGIVLIALSFKKKDCAQNDDGEEKQQAQAYGEQTLSSFCEYSEEAKRIGLHDILVRAKKSYYEYNPFLLTSDPDATRDEIKEKYTAYNPKTEHIKQVTDAARKLLKEVNEAEVDTNKLKSRKRKALSQIKHFLKTVFGLPYDMNYYAGHWMMGPTYVCFKHMFCSVGRHLSSMLKKLKPESLEDVKVIEQKLKSHKEGILQYKKNFTKMMMMMMMMMVSFINFF